MKKLKRISAVLLALAMFVTMLPIYSLTISAAGTLSVSDANIGLSWTDASNSRGSANWTASGTTITGIATGYKMIISRSITTKLTITNNYTDARTLSFTYTLSGGSVSGISGNAYSGELAAGGSLTITLTSPSGASTATLIISNIQMLGNEEIVSTFLAPQNGSYTVDGTAVTAETTISKAATTSYTLSATPASGYMFFGWYSEASGEYISNDATTTQCFSSDPRLKPVFVPSTTALFGVGDQKFFDLTTACNTAASGSIKTVVALNNGTVTGSHTIPAGVTLLVPYNADNSVHGANPSCTSYDYIQGAIFGGTGHVDWVKPTAYRTLTLAADATITVNGVIEVGGQHASAGGGKGMYGGSPTGPLGFINMLAGSHIDLNSGATLYCWGYIYGDGTITAKSGAAIYENFQLQDFRGGDKSTALAEGFLVFPTAQYYVQNIEVATRYEYGSTEYVHTSVYIALMEYGATVQFIGSNAMFRPQPGSYVIKDYDPTTDNLILESYGDCALSELSMEIAGTPINSADFVLPITNNMQIYIKSGTATLQQNVMMLPGSSITVDQGATLNLAYTDATTDVVTAGGYILQMFDYTNYTYGIDQDTFEVVTGRYYNHYGSTGKRRFQAVPYTCTTRKTRTEADLVDAMLNINGTVISNGFIYSTVDYADILNEDYTITGGGANICSSEGTGVLQMVNGAGGDILGIMYDQDCAEAVDKGGEAGDGVYYYIPLASVQLKNGDGSLVDTTYAEAGTVYEYCAEHDCWYTGECEACSDPCADGHSYDNACDTDCNVCGEVRTITHSYNAVVTAPDCVNGGYTTYTCSVCGHSYVGDYTDELGHKYDNACDADCNVCGEGREINHSYNAVVTAPDCVNGGYTTYTCSVCGDSYVADETDATGHNYVGEQTTAPTCGDVGVMTYTCSACGDNYTEAIAATGAHSYDHDFDANCNVCDHERDVTLPFAYVGASVMEMDDGLYGLAMLFTIEAANVTRTSGPEFTAIFDGATCGSYQLKSVGVIASNMFGPITIEGKRLFGFDDESGLPQFAFRITNIPETAKDVDITMVPYVILLIDGKEVTIYGEAQTANYQEVLDKANNAVE